MAARKTPSAGGGDRFIVHWPHTFEDMLEGIVEQAVADYREHKTDGKRVLSPYRQDGCAEHAPDAEQPCIAEMRDQRECANHIDWNSARDAVGNSLIDTAECFAYADFVGDRGEQRTRSNDDAKAHRQVNDQQNLARRTAIFARHAVAMHEPPDT